MHLRISFNLMESIKLMSVNIRKFYKLAQMLKYTYVSQYSHVEVRIFTPNNSG